VRSEILSELRSVVRKMLLENAEGLEIPFLHILDEMEHFTINPNTGRSEALDKHHDDFVMALAFAFFLKAKGTMLSGEVGQSLLPPDVRGMLQEQMQAQILKRGHGAHRI
jgi:hypothetical protein